MPNLASRIHRARLSVGWSQNELASRAGVKQPTLQRIEAGLRKNPSLDTIISLARALHLSVDALALTANVDATLLTEESLKGIPIEERLKALEIRMATVEAQLKGS